MALFSLEKILKYSPKIKNLTAFLHYLISLNDPTIAFTKKPHHPNPLLPQTNHSLKPQHSFSIFKPLKPTKISNLTRYTLQLLINKQKPKQHFLQAFQNKREVWNQQVSKLVNPNFPKTIPLFTSFGVKPCH